LSLHRLDEINIRGRVSGGRTSRTETHKEAKGVTG